MGLELADQGQGQGAESKHIFTLICSERLLMTQSNTELYNEIHDLVDTIKGGFPGLSTIEVLHWAALDDIQHSIDYLGKIVIRALSGLNSELDIVVVKFYLRSPIKVYKVQNPQHVCDAVNIDSLVECICSWLKHANPGQKRTRERCAVFKDELLSIVWHPDNVFRLGLVVGF